MLLIILADEGGRSEYGLKRGMVVALFVQSTPASTKTTSSLFPFPALTNQMHIRLLVVELGVVDVAMGIVDKGGGVVLDVKHSVLTPPEAEGEGHEGEGGILSHLGPSAGNETSEHYGLIFKMLKKGRGK